MSNGDEQPGIHVDDLGEPDEQPAFTDDELDGAAAAEAAETPPLTDQEAGNLMGELVGIPFAYAGRLYAARAPQSAAGQLAAAQVLELWPLQPEEADRIGGRVWAAIPARFRETGRRALEASPLVLAIGSLAQAIRVRQAATGALYQWAAIQEETPGDSGINRAAGAARPDAGNTGDGGRRQPRAAGSGVAVADDAPPGLGLSGVVTDGAARRRERRFAAEAPDRAGGGD